MIKVSIVIVTKDRSSSLNECISSLLLQTEKLDELIVIDNNSSDNTKDIVNKISEKNNINIKYVCEKKIGFPYVRNRGLKEASGNWVAFIDDDCIADKNWYKNILVSTEKNQSVAAITGLSKTFYLDSIFSFTFFVLNEFWKKNQINGEKVIDLEVLDSKNIVYNKKYLKEKNIFFDESRVNAFSGACEDSDIGMQIQREGGMAIFNKKMVVFHKDPTSFLSFYKKIIFSTRSNLVYKKKWNSFRKKLDIKRKKKIIPFSLFFLKSYKKKKVFYLFFMLNLILVLFVTKFIRFYSDLYSFFERRINK